MFEEVVLIPFLFIKFQRTKTSIAFYNYPVTLYLANIYIFIFGFPFGNHDLAKLARYISIIIGNYNQILTMRLKSSPFNNKRII